MKDFHAIHALVLDDFHRHPAPVIDLIAAQGASPFHILLATILSARTKDVCTAKVIREKLFPVVHSWEDIRRLSVDEIASLIHPVGFFRQKAQAIKHLPDVIEQRFHGEIPQTVEELVELPGVGRKTANLVVAVAFQKPAICVDIHVHRIMNRMGIVQTDTPLQTEMTLRQILPQPLWQTWNACFVSLGQRICTPRNPHCYECPIRDFCDNAPSCKPILGSVPHNSLIQC